MRRVAAIALLLVAFGAVLAPPAVAKKKKPDTCDLLTKKQVSKFLGFKVVETGLEKERSTGAEQCEYRTAKYWTESLENLDAPLKMQVTTQPLTPEVEASLAALEAEDGAETVTGLGDRAFYTDGNDLIAVVGPLVIQVEVTNVQWSGDELQRYILGPERDAMEVLVALFEDV
ncbi:MAG: hypothetical protein FJW95_00245 [Actinobacteria bacterium]|nr:hypothetical protein [Actinomycetota bacterium]